MITTIITTTLLCGMDKLLYFFNVKNRYYINFIFMNLLIAYYTFNDVLFIYNDFYNNLYNFSNLSINTMAIELTYSTHFYHIIMYYNDFLLNNWLYHFIMMFLVIPIGIFTREGAIYGHSMFFLTGIPLGIYYLLLYCEDIYLVNTQTVINYNHYLNLFIRKPACIITTILSLFIINNLSIIERILSFYLILCHSIMEWDTIYYIN